MLTVDTPVPGPRLRDVRNGLTIPPSLSLRTFAEGALHPAWWFDLLTTEPLEFASLNRFEGTVAELVGRMFDPAATMADLAGCARSGTGPLVVKGIQHVADARAVVDAGADAVVVSNHGAASSTGPPPRWRRCPPWSTRWATGPRCTSTAASCRAATSSPPSRSVRGRPWWAALTSTG